MSMSFATKLRYILKVVSAAAWVIILPVTYAYTWENPTGLARTIKSWVGNGQHQPSLYILAVVIYLSPNMLSALLFLFPLIRRLLERSNYKIVMLMMWWSQVLPNLQANRHRFSYCWSINCALFSFFWFSNFYVRFVLNMAATSLCWKGNAWKCIFTFHVRWFMFLFSASFEMGWLLFAVSNTICQMAQVHNVLGVAYSYKVGSQLLYWGKQFFYFRSMVPTLYDI